MKLIHQIFVSGLFIFFLFVLPVSVFAAAPAASPTPEKVETITTVTTVATEYELPYPGILPNNPLYFLKQFRDFLLEKLIVDPVKKAEFYLLQADKRLSMAILLTEAEAEEFSNQAITQAEVFIGQSIGELTNIKDQGKEVPAYLIDRLEKSMAKHLEILTGELMRATTDARKGAVQGAIDTLGKLQDALAKLK